MDVSHVLFDILGLGLGLERGLVGRGFLTYFMMVLLLVLLWDSGWL